MAKVYLAPKEIVNEANQYLGDWEASREAEKRYEDAILNYCLKNGSGDLRGNEARFQVADGYARYAVLSTKPLKLIHIDTGDGYEFPYIERLTAKDIKENVERQINLAKIFGGGK